MPRNLKKCFTHHKGIDKDTPFQFCFAFNLGLAESEAFLRKVCRNGDLTAMISKKLFIIMRSETG